MTGRRYSLTSANLNAKSFHVKEFCARRSRVTLYLPERVTMIIELTTGGSGRASIFSACGPDGSVYSANRRLSNKIVDIDRLSADDFRRERFKRLDFHPLGTLGRFLRAANDVLHISEHVHNWTNPR